MISIPVAASRARILRPSRPMMRPFISSESIWKIVTEFSIAVSVATRWIDWTTILFASLFAVIFASSIISLIYEAAAVLASSLSDSMSLSFASSEERPEIDSSSWRSERISLSNSSLRASFAAICASRLARTLSSSFLVRWFSPCCWFS